MGNYLPGVVRKAFEVPLDIDSKDILQFMHSMPEAHEPGQMMEATAPDGQVMKFQAPAVQPGGEFPVAYKRGGRGGQPPVDTDLMLAMHVGLEAHGVTRAQASDLLVLSRYDIMLLIDDSTKMRTIDAGCSQSRWEELHDSVKHIISLAACFDKDGLDIHFLNRATISHVLTPDDENFKKAMSDRAFGKSPLLEGLQEIADDVRTAISRKSPLAQKLIEIADKRERMATVHEALREKPILLMIFSDGEPLGGREKFVAALRDVLENRNIEICCQIMACTGRDSADLKWLDKIDEEFQKLDVTDDFETEKKKAEARGFMNFSRGDWVLKALLGGVLEKYDHDTPSEPPLKRSRTSESAVDLALL